jgi:hypothetical protein
MASLCLAGCDGGVIRVDLTWNDQPSRVDRVDLPGLVAPFGSAPTRDVFPLQLTISDKNVPLGEVAATASYRGLPIAAGHAAVVDGAVTIALASRTGLDALRPCSDDDQCAKGYCGPKLTFSEGLWSCVTECYTGAPCPGGSTCDASTGVCVPGCVSDDDCAPRGPSDPFAISAWTCRSDGICAIK